MVACLFAGGWFAVQDFWFAGGISGGGWRVCLCLVWEFGLGWEL